MAGGRDASKDASLEKLFGQNQLVLAGDSQPVGLACVLDQDLLLTRKENLTVIPVFCCFTAWRWFA